jgi:hypothetical protein
LFVIPEDCIITAANILPKLSLVLIFLVQTKKLLKLAFILHVQFTYQLVISRLSTIDFEEVLGRSMMSFSVVIEKVPVTQAIAIVEVTSVE